MPQRQSVSPSTCGVSSAFSRSTRCPDGTAAGGIPPAAAARNHRLRLPQYHKRLLLQNVCSALIGLAFGDLHAGASWYLLRSCCSAGDAVFSITMPAASAAHSGDAEPGVIVLIGLVVASDYKHLEASKYIPLFPLLF